MRANGQRWQDSIGYLRFTKDEKNTLTPRSKLPTVFRDNKDQNKMQRIVSQSIVKTDHITDHREFSISSEDKITSREESHLGMGLKSARIRVKKNLRRG